MFKNKKKGIITPPDIDKEEFLEKIRNKASDGEESSSSEEGNKKLSILKDISMLNASDSTMKIEKELIKQSVIAASVHLSMEQNKVIFELHANLMRDLRKLVVDVVKLISLGFFNEEKPKKLK